jgi:hypothetical protein
LMGCAITVTPPPVLLLLERLGGLNFIVLCAMRHTEHCRSAGCDRCAVLVLQQLQLTGTHERCCFVARLHEGFKYSVLHHHPVIMTIKGASAVESQAFRCLQLCNLRFWNHSSRITRHVLPCPS